MIYILLFTIAMIASAAYAAWDAREKKMEDEDPRDEYGYTESDYEEVSGETKGEISA